jgi:hypothetical protein
MGITENILKADNIDRWATGKNLKTVGPKTDVDKEIEEFTYSLQVPEEPYYRLMEAEEAYEFNKRATQLLDKWLSNTWKNAGDRKKLEAMSDENAQAYLTKMWTACKERSFYELNLKVYPGLNNITTEEEFKNRVREAKNRIMTEQGMEIDAEQKADIPLILMDHKPFE